MPASVRLGDINAAGGAVLPGKPSFVVSNKPIATIRMFVTPHAPCPIVPIHCAAMTIGGSNSFIIEGKPASLVGDPDTCGHPRVTGDTTFIIGR